MQEENNRQTIVLVVKGAEITKNILLKAIQIFLQKQKELRQKGISKASTKQQTGQQSVKQLIGQGQGAENIEINSSNIGLFRSSARKYGVDFALKRDNSTDPPRHLVFFKGKDTAAITSAFKDFVAKERKQQATKQAVKQSVRKNIAKLKQQIIASELQRAVKNKDVHFSRDELAKQMRKTNERSL